MRPLLHPTAPVGWLNDPNGSVVVGGRLHVFHQWNPHDVTFGAMAWGHLVSDDLVTWRHEGLALAPGATDDLDAAGCWSGCASLGADGLEFFYTAVAGERHETQRPRLARPSDGLRTLTPVGGYLADPPTDFSLDFRDPFVWGHTGARHMLMAGRTADWEPVLCVLSEDAEGWHHQRVLGTPDGLAFPGWLWECAHVVTGADSVALVVSVVEGQPDRERFSVWGAVGSSALCDWAEPVPLDDAGRFYAAQTFDHPDGRTLMIGWVRTQDDSAGAGVEWTGALSLLREVFIADGRVQQRPVAELDTALRPLSWAQRTATSAEFEPQSCVELRVRGASRLTLSDGERDWTLPLGEWADGAPARVFFDAGIVEVFADGRSWVVTDLSLTQISRVHTDGELVDLHRLALG